MSVRANGTILYSHPQFLDHETGRGHPERVDRLRAISQALEDEKFSFLERLQPPQAAREQILRVHTARHVDHVLETVPTTGLAFLDTDTPVSPGSGLAALHAAGAVCDAVDLVLGGKARNAFCAVRPPGHHAEPDRAMGFCLFNNIAIGALHALEAHGLKRVAVIDFDVHHGNGTEAVAREDARIFFGSSHEWGNYPGTGRPEDHGRYGNLLNVALPHGAGSHDFRAGIEDQLLPALDAFEPELIFISAGFDAHRADPLGGITLDDNDFAWATEKLCRMAEARCQARIVSSLEGGYDLPALAASAAAHLTALQEG